MRIGTFIRKSKRLLLLTLGLICLGLGIVGYVLPGLPGTIWLIIAATLFVRSSDRLYNFVVNHRLFGEQVKGFLETGSIPLKVKFISLVSMWGFTLVSVLLAPYGILFDVPISLLALAGTIYIVSRPTTKNPD